eukprot:9502332-Pyramimonas_sp.AAC.1
MGRPTGAIAKHIARQFNPPRNGLEKTLPGSTQFKETSPPRTPCRRSNLRANVSRQSPRSGSSVRRRMPRTALGCLAASRGELDPARC